MTTKRFKSAMTKAGSRTIISVPFDPNDVWGAKDRHYVEGTVNGLKMRSLLESAGDKYFFALGPKWLNNRGVGAGLEVEVVLQPDSPRVEDLAADVATALQSDTDACGQFESMAGFYRRNYIRWVESAKRQETRANRIKEMIQSLKDGKRRM